MRPLIQVVARMVQKDPKLADNIDYLMATLSANIPNFDDVTKCAICGANMTEYIYAFTVIDALLLLAMAKKVSKNMQTYPNFTAANAIHIPSLEDINKSSLSRQGYAGKLGLIAKLRGPNKRPIRGTWAITKRGWSALRGEPIPKSVRIFRGKILDRPEEMTTINELFKSYSTMIERKIRQGKVVKSDRRPEIQSYNPNEWIEITSINQGELL